LSFFLVPSHHAPLPLQSVTSQGMCLNSLLFCCFQFRLTFESIKEFGSHYNNKGLFCDPNIIANTKERSFRKPAIANHNSSQTLKLLRYHNIHTRIITSFSQLSNSIQSQNFSDCNYFYTLFVINNASETICNKPITATT